MARQVREIRQNPPNPAESTTRQITLRLVEPGDTQQEPPAPCLLSMIPLRRPTIRSSPTHKLRLKDSLAGGSARINAGIIARDPHFWDYLQQISLAAYDAEIDTRRARMFINRVCDVSGRYDLDRNETAVQRFFALIEQPFLEWLFNEN